MYAHVHICGCVQVCIYVNICMCVMHKCMQWPVKGIGCPALLSLNLELGIYQVPAILLSSSLTALDVRLVLGHYQHFTCEEFEWGPHACMVNVYILPSGSPSQLWVRAPFKETWETVLPLLLCKQQEGTIYNSGNRLSMCLAQDFSATQTVGNKFCGLGVTEAVLKAPRVNKDGFTFAVHFFLWCNYLS